MGFFKNTGSTIPEYPLCDPSRIGNPRLEIEDGGMFTIPGHKKIFKLVRVDPNDGFDFKNCEQCYFNQINSIICKCPVLCRADHRIEAFDIIDTL